MKPWAEGAVNRAARSPSGKCCVDGLLPVDEDGIHVADSSPTGPSAASMHSVDFMCSEHCASTTAVRFRAFLSPRKDTLTTMSPLCLDVPVLDFHVDGISHRVASAFGSCHRASCVQDPSTQRVLVPPPSSQPSGIPACGRATLCLSIEQLMDTWVASTYWQL